MNRFLILSAVVISSTTFSVSASANDIVDFFRALNSPSPRYVPVRDNHGRDIHRTGFHSGDRHDDHHDHGHGSPAFSGRRAPVVTRRSGTSFSVSIGTGPVRVGVPVRTAGPPIPVLPPAPVVVNPYPAVHHIGDIVTCPVPLETCVVVKDEDEIAPGAIPTVVAVRDPHATCANAPVVFVQVFAPPCPPQKVKISPCGTKVRLDFGRYEIDLVSRNNVIEIDYDN